MTDLFGFAAYRRYCFLFFARFLQDIPGVWFYLAILSLRGARAVSYKIDSRFCLLGRAMIYFHQEN